jgi:hypothetical protein
VNVGCAKPLVTEPGFEYGTTDAELSISRPCEDDEAAAAVAVGQDIGTASDSRREDAAELGGGRRHLDSSGHRTEPPPNQDCRVKTARGLGAVTRCALFPVAAAV